MASGFNTVMAPSQSPQLLCGADCSLGLGCSNSSLWANLHIPTPRCPRTGVSNGPFWPYMIQAQAALCNRKRTRVCTGLLPARPGVMGSGAEWGHSVGVADRVWVHLGGEQSKSGWGGWSGQDLPPHLYAASLCLDTICSSSLVTKSWFLPSSYLFFLLLILLNYFKLNLAGFSLPYI